MVADHRDVRDETWLDVLEVPDQTHKEFVAQMQELKSKLLRRDVDTVQDELQDFQVDIFSIQHTLLHDIAAGSLISKVKKPLSA